MTKKTAIDVARAATAAAADAARTAEDAAAEATKAAQLLADLETRVRAGDASVKFDQLERQRSLVMFAQLNAEGAAARLDAAIAERDAATDASTAEWIGPAKDAVNAYLAAVHAASETLTDEALRTLIAARGAIFAARATFDAFVAQVNEEHVPVVFDSQGQVIVGRDGRHQTVGSVRNELDAHRVVEAALDQALGMVALVEAAGEHLAGTDGLDDVASAIARHADSGSDAKRLIIESPLRSDPDDARTVRLYGKPIGTRSTFDVTPARWRALVALATAERAKAAGGGAA